MSNSDGPSPDLALFSKLADDAQPRTLAELRAVLEKAEAAAANEARDPKDLEIVRVYNRARKQFRHDDYLAQPSSFVEIPRWLAVKWMAMFPDDIITGEAALSNIDASAIKAAESEKKNAALEQEKAALATELEAARAALKKLQDAVGGP